MEWNMAIFFLMAGQLVVTVTGFMIIKFNDFKHVGEQIKTIIDKQSQHDDKFDAQSKELQGIAVKVAYLEGSTGRKYTTRRKTTRAKSADKKTSKAKKDIIKK